VKSNNNFGERIRELRAERGLSQEDLAECSGLHRTYISGIERGVRNPTLSIILQIASALKVHPSELFLTGGAGEAKS
jgi:transcriptional regulator with XRE-family HTH domain